MTFKTISLFGHSHSVCLLDALGPWRDIIKHDVGINEDDRYTEAFQGWFNHDMTDVDLQLNYAADGDDQKINVSAFPIFGGASEQNLVRRRVDKNGQGHLLDTPALVSYIERMKGSELILSCLFGNEFARYIYVNNLPTYDFVEVGRSSVSRLHNLDAQPIDRQFILELLRPMVRKIVNVLRIVQHYLPDVRIVHLLPPPPLENPQEASRKEIFKDAFERHGILNKALRLKWYRSYCVVAHRYLERYGIKCLAPPHDVQTPDGFLMPEFAEGLTHGNADYGRQVWRIVTRELET